MNDLEKLLERLSDLIAENAKQHPDGDPENEMWMPLRASEARLLLDHDRVLKAAIDIKKEAQNQLFALEMELSMLRRQLPH